VRATEPASSRKGTGIFLSTTEDRVTENSLGFSSVTLCLCGGAVALHYSLRVQQLR